MAENKKATDIEHDTKKTSRKETESKDDVLEFLKDVFHRAEQKGLFDMPMPKFRE